MAAQLSEIDATTLDSLQRFTWFIQQEREFLKAKLSRGEICQATFDELDPVGEESLLEVNQVIEHLKSQE